MKPDAQLQADIEAELDWDPSIDARGIKVAVKDGTVILTGATPSYPDKTGAESAVKRVAGVRAVTNDLSVNLPDADTELDETIAQEAARVLATQVPLWADRIKVTVTERCLTLEGDVEWHFQKDAVEAAAAHTRGIEDVVDKIRIEPRVTPIRVKEEVELALRRAAIIEPGAVIVTTKGGAVTLEGETRSLNERTEIERVAWSAPGVWRVDNRITVSG
jgi:osmotically-inducible protein OsmY